MAEIYNGRIPSLKRQINTAVQQMKVTGRSKRQMIYSSLLEIRNGFQTLVNEIASECSEEEKDNRKRGS